MAAQGKPASAEMQNFLVQQQAKAQLQQTISRLTDECWGKCVGNPGKQAPAAAGCRPRLLQGYCRASAGLLQGCCRAACRCGVLRSAQNGPQEWQIAAAGRRRRRLL